MPNAFLRAGTGVLCVIGFQFGILAAHADDDIGWREPVCTVEGEPRCWSPEEVDLALANIFCPAGQSCRLPVAYEGVPRVRIQAHGTDDELRLAPPPVTESENSETETSGVPEFNAWEDGCD